VAAAVAAWVAAVAAAWADDMADVGVMAQEVEAMRPEAVVRHSDSYLRVDYDLLGFRMQWEDWVSVGKRIPTPSVH
jgi:hypothetical protein